MEDFFGSPDDSVWDFDYRSDYRPHRRVFEEEERDFGNERLYLVPHRWWKDVEGDNADKIEGVLYTVSSNFDLDLDMELQLKKEEYYDKSKDAEVGFSGRQYAIVPEGMWLLALKRHGNFNIAMKSFNSLFVEDYQPEFFPLQVRIFVSWKTNSLVAKISQKENAVDIYKKACVIFSSTYSSMHIWDFSGQTIQLFIDDGANLPNGFPGQAGKEVLLELQVHGLPNSAGGNESREMIADSSQMECSSHSGSFMINGSTDSVKTVLTASSSFQSSSYKIVGSLGLTGLKNLGNTCFMNSAIQCLVHTPKLVDFFLGDYRKEINYENPLGMNGELALAFGDLLRKLWVPGARPVTPRMFKTKLSNFAPQFSGYNQHDSQELLAFLLDGLHEDLNRVKRKPYHIVKDEDGRPDEEVAEEYWRNHLARNDSIIVDLCQGQFRSTLVCPVCRKVSVTFDPFMYLSLPLPSTTTRSMTLTVVSTDGTTLPSKFTITVPKYGKSSDLIEALSAACFLRDDETLLVVEVYKNKIVRFLEDPTDSLVLIRDGDTLVAYRLRKDNEAGPLVVFMHKKLENRSYPSWSELGESSFGIPLVTRLSSVSCGYDIQREFLKLVNPFLMPTEVISDDENDEKLDNKPIEDNGMSEAISLADLEGDAGSDSGTEDDIDWGADFEFYLLPEKFGIGSVRIKIKLNKELPVTELPKQLGVAVIWSDRMIERYDTCLLSSLPEVFEQQVLAWRAQESVSVYQSLEAFLKEEPLGPEDMWFCPHCKKRQQATKKLDLWRLPEVLVVHLKRFSYNRFFNNKLETFVDFPIDDLDFSSYVAYKNNPSSKRYELFAISCHYGSVGGGHYTAFVRFGLKTWYEFDDSRVSPTSEDTIKASASAAYVLFYRRV